MRVESPALIRLRGATPSSGVTLVELLVASVVAAVVLAGAWGWLWSIGGVATAMDEDAQAATAAAAATRAVVRDVRAAVAVLPPATGADRATSLHLQHDGLGTAPDDVVIVWDAGRQVLWRNASGTYLSDRVTGFEVSYLLDDGRRVDGGAITGSDLAMVRSVCLSVSIRVGTSSAQREVRVAMGAS